LGLKGLEKTLCLMNNKTHACLRTHFPFLLPLPIIIAVSPSHRRRLRRRRPFSSISRRLYPSFVAHRVWPILALFTLYRSINHLPKSPSFSSKLNNKSYANFMTLFLLLSHWIFDQLMLKRLETTTIFLFSRRICVVPILRFLSWFDFWVVVCGSLRRRCVALPPL